MKKPDLQKRWVAFWKRTGASGDAEKAYSKLAEQYNSPPRAYHNLNHISRCLDEFEEVRHLAEHPNELEMAIWYHDAIYDPEAKDNEEKSANLACKFVRAAGLPGSFGKRVRDLILATTHAKPPTDFDAKLLVDIDLSILGRPWDEFDAYEKKVVEEYRGIYTEKELRAGRAGVLSRFLDRRPLYLTEHFRKKYDARARENMKKALDTKWAAPQ